MESMHGGEDFEGFLDNVGWVGWEKFLSVWLCRCVVVCYGFFDVMLRHPQPI